MIGHIASTAWKGFSEQITINSFHPTNTYHTLGRQYAGSLSVPARAEAQVYRRSWGYLSFLSFSVYKVRTSPPKNNYALYHRLLIHTFKKGSVWANSVGHMGLYVHLRRRKHHLPYGDMSINRLVVFRCHICWYIRTYIYIELLLCKHARA